MKFAGFDWDAGNREKCRKHGVTVEEIEGLFSRRVLIVHDLQNSIAENRYRAIGTTMTGRKVFVAFTMRGDEIRPVSARFMHQREVDRYETDNPDF